MPQLLQAGSIQVRYENGFLRYFTYNQSEILRMIYFAVRDHNWQTATFSITNEEIVQESESFRVQYDWQIDDLGILMVGQVDIKGEASGQITVDFYGRALNAFRKNRIGLCVLHPLKGVLGQPAEIDTPTGERVQANFPTFINPHQPFLEVQTLRWRTASETSWQLNFSGDIFETEDQRNWTDASFKTYSTPQRIPFPVSVAAGEEFRQQVVFHKATEPVGGPTPIQLPQERTEKKQASMSERPHIGVGQKMGGVPLTDTEIELLRRLRLSHLRTDVFFTLPDWKGYLVQAIRDAQRLAVPLELAIFFGENPVAELADLGEILTAESASVYSILLFEAATLTTSDTLLQKLVPVLRSEWPDIAIGGGTDDNFVELNRNPFDFGLVDFVTYSICPQIHAFDVLTLLENIDGQAETVRSAIQLTEGKPIHISPVTLLPRFATITETATERLNAPADPRHVTTFAADWTRQSLDALTKAGATSITYYQTHGLGGLVDQGEPLPVFQVLGEFL